MDSMNYIRIIKRTIKFLMCLFIIILFYKSDIFRNGNKPHSLLKFKANPSLWDNFTHSIRITQHNNSVKRFLDKRQAWKTSNLGSILYKNHECQDYKKQAKNFTVLIYKRSDWLKYRYFKPFGEILSDPLNKCSVKNCVFTGNKTMINEVDAVLINVQNAKIPRKTLRKQDQIWIFAIGDLYATNPIELGSKTPDALYLANVFNWSMHYRHDADIPVPYGRVVPLKAQMNDELNEYNIIELYDNYQVDTDVYTKLTELVPGWDEKRRDVFVTILYSNCINRRNKIVQQLSKHVEIHVYGQCSNDIAMKNRCPGRFKTECKPISSYLFYLVIEETQCSEYLTEKIFFHAYEKGLIPIIIGISLDDCKVLLPPLSYIHIDNYPSLEGLAESLVKIASVEAELYLYHKWRNSFTVLNEHGYFGTEAMHYCRLCEALNYNSYNYSVYDVFRMRQILNLDTDCS